mgnify:CR=1 FL=1
MKPTSRLKLPHIWLRMVPVKFSSAFLLLLSKTTAETIAGSKYTRNSAGELDACVKMTRRTHF